ncbi:FAD-dependent oxidoreductase [Halogeometricum sp. S1BR25-6]|uniref:FAD-dependent oxidoreductase n=1 Tax=Halogeometricum salsisoli TaxID=2950536 RepID=A0ABU2GHK3_9EURY|nr:FAD-dependent oxidoreductase [Halogeometricum sp. S1BR25-6]MDS0300282.1 FAD-dependent oxidoreductase [Halogeometricum sp. S1BR25-6]
MGVTIIGAGVAGCTTGYLLSQRGYDVTIVEKGGIGGLLREIEFDTGYHCDSAPHLLFYDETEEAIVGELFSEFSELDAHDFYAKTYPTGTLDEPHDYPVTKANIDLWDDSEQIWDELANAEGKTDADYFDQYMLKQVGPTLYERYNEGYTRKHWGVEPERITGDWFDFKISFPEEEDSFFSGGAYYPQKKYTTILKEMISDCDVVFDGVTGLDTDGDRIQSLVTENGQRLEDDRFVSTIDPSILVDDVDATFDYRSMVIYGAHIEASERLFPSHVNWGYFPNDYEFTRVTDYDFTPQSIPEGEYILTVEFPCFIDEDLWTRSDEWFDDYVRSFLDEQGVEAEILDSQTRRAPRAYPLPVEEEIQKFELINGRLSEYENMFNLGRVSTYEYIWIKDIVQQAYETVDEITATVTQ